MPYRQEVLNVILAQELQRRGVVSAPEDSRLSPEQGQREIPDVIVHYNGLRLAIEGEYAGPEAESKAAASALRRVSDGVAHVGVAVVYPRSLRTGTFLSLPGRLTQATLRVAVLTESSEKPNYADGDINFLKGVLSAAFEQLVKEDVVAEAVQSIGLAIEQFTLDVAGRVGDAWRLAEALGIRSLKAEKDEGSD